MDYDYLLGKISVVMQNVILFSDTIANNIKVGNQHATQEEIEEAARRAMIHDFYHQPVRKVMKQKSEKTVWDSPEGKNKGFQSPVLS